MKRRYYRNGKRVTRTDYVVHEEDDGFLRGLSAFETMRAFHGAIFRPKHIRSIWWRVLARSKSVPSIKISSRNSQRPSQTTGEARCKSPSQ